MAYSMSVAVSESEIRAAKYLSESIAVNTGHSAKLVADTAIADRRDISFVSLGLTSNLKSRDMINNSANDFVRVEVDRFRSQRSGKNLVSASQTSDFGLIMKISPSNLHDRTWICCAGFGEWGTSGAAWYLARNWRTLRSKYRKGSFAVIVRVEPQRDESAEPVVMAGSGEEIERYGRD
jgi:hypothetical protein